MTPSRPSRRAAVASLAMAATVLASSAVQAQSPSASEGAAGSPRPAASLTGESITVYNAQHESLTQAWADAFTRETGIAVVLRNGEDPELGNQLVQEGAASPADVFLTENSPAMALVEHAGLFAPVDRATLDQVPTQYRPSSGLWAGIAARSTVFAYDKRAFTADQLPASLLDLENSEWRGRWAASPSGADFQAIVSALLALKGEDATREWLAGMKQNALAYQGNRAVMAAVNAGEVAGGVIYHYYWFGDQANTGESSNNVALHYFKNQDPGAFVSLSGGGVLASSQHQAAAQSFLRFITGVDGQMILQTGTSFEYPVASGVAANPALVPLDELDAPAIDPSTLDSALTTQLMTEAGIL